jgi:hypothetical protein
MKSFEELTLAELSARVYFADWVYLRAGVKCTMPQCEAAFQSFLEGNLIEVRVTEEGVKIYDRRRN